MTRAQKIEAAARTLVARLDQPDVHLGGTAAVLFHALRAALSTPADAPAPAEQGVGRVAMAERAACAARVQAQIDRLRACAGPMMRPKPGVIEVLEEAVVHILAGDLKTVVCAPAPQERTKGTIVVCNAPSSVGHHCRREKEHAPPHRDRHGNEWVIEPVEERTEDGECRECHGSGRVLMRLWNGGSWNETGVGCPGCAGTGLAPKEGK